MFSDHFLNRLNPVLLQLSLRVNIMNACVLFVVGWALVRLSPPFGLNKLHEAEGCNYLKCWVWSIKICLFFRWSHHFAIAELIGDLGNAFIFSISVKKILTRSTDYLSRHLKTQVSTISSWPQWIYARGPPKKNVLSQRRHHCLNVFGVAALNLNERLWLKVCVAFEVLCWLSQWDLE